MFLLQGVCATYLDMLGHTPEPCIWVTQLSVSVQDVEAESGRPPGQWRGGWSPVIAGGM